MKVSQHDFECVVGTQGNSMLSDLTHKSSLECILAYDN